MTLDKVTYLLRTLVSLIKTGNRSTELAPKFKQLMYADLDKWEQLFYNTVDIV